MVMFKIVSGLPWPDSSVGWSIFLYTKKVWVQSLFRWLRKATNWCFSHWCFSSTLSPPPCSLSKRKEGRKEWVTEFALHSKDAAAKSKSSIIIKVKARGWFAVAQWRIFWFLLPIYLLWKFAPQNFWFYTQIAQSFPLFNHWFWCFKVDVSDSVFYITT